MKILKIIAPIISVGILKLISKFIFNDVVTPGEYIILAVLIFNHLDLKYED